jgi:hypothetical protein
VGCTLRLRWHLAVHLNTTPERQRVEDHNRPKWTELQVPPWRFAIVWMEYSVSSQALATQDGCRITHEFQRYVSKDDASLRLEFYYGNGSSIAVIDFAPLVRALFWCGVRCSEQTTNATQVTRGILGIEGYTGGFSIPEGCARLTCTEHICTTLEQWHSGARWAELGCGESRRGTTRTRRCERCPHHPPSH